MANKDDYLTYYREFFENFAQTVNPNDQLPVKLASYKLVNIEVVGAIIDWTTQYLSQKNCPSNLVAPLVKIVIEEIRKACKKQPVMCGFNVGDNAYEPLKLMQTVMAKANEVCLRYLDNSMLCSLPTPGAPFFPTSACAVKNSRRHMEDRHVIVHDLNTMFSIQEASPSSYYAVFDGHAGHHAAVYSAAHLHQYLAENQYFVSDPEKALLDAFCKTDALFIEKCKVENLSSGTTAVVALLRPKEKVLYIAWVGDSQAVLVSEGNVQQIVHPHKPCRLDERNRIHETGGCVTFWGIWRVNGQLGVSRAIGDAAYKPHVIAIPDIHEIFLDGSEDFLILACDGLWDFLPEMCAARAVYRLIAENSDDTDRIGQHLVQLAKQQGSNDNISVIVVFLREPSKIAAEAHRANRNSQNATTAAETMETGFDNANNPFAISNGGSNADNILSQKTDSLLLNLTDKYKQNDVSPSGDFPGAEEKSKNGNSKRTASSIFDDEDPEDDEDDEDDDFGPETNVDALSPLLDTSKGFFAFGNNNPAMQVEEAGVLNPFVEHQEKAAAAVQMERGLQKMWEQQEGEQQPEEREQHEEKEQGSQEEHVEQETQRLARDETPTPPADAVHDVSGLEENVAESDSEDEWNYIKGEEANKENIEPQPSKKEVGEISEEDDAMSQLNPNAAEFVPVSPTRSIPSPACRMIMNDEVISQSPKRPLNVDINVPNPKDFEKEVKSRPSEVDSYSNGRHDESDDESAKSPTRAIEDLLLNSKTIDEIPEFQPGSTPQKSKPSEEFHFGPNAAPFTPVKLLDQSEAALSTKAVFGDESTITLDATLNESPPQIDLLGKESDPMSMSFYADKDEANPFDLNRVQVLPDNIDDFLEQPEQVTKANLLDTQEIFTLNNDDAIQTTDLDKQSYDDEKELASPLEPEKEFLEPEKDVSGKEECDRAAATPEPMYENLVAGEFCHVEKSVSPAPDALPEDVETIAESKSPLLQATEVADLLRTEDVNILRDVEVIDPELLTKMSARLEHEGDAAVVSLEPTVAREVQDLLMEPESKSPIPQSDLRAYDDGFSASPLPPGETCDFTGPELIQEAQRNFEELCAPREADPVVSPLDDVTSFPKDDVSPPPATLPSETPADVVADDRIALDADVSRVCEDIEERVTTPLPEVLAPEIESSPKSVANTESVAIEPSLPLEVASPSCCPEQELVESALPAVEEHFKEDEQKPEQIDIKTEIITPEFAEQAVVTPSEESKQEDVCVTEPPKEIVQVEEKPPNDIVIEEVAVAAAAVAAAATATIAIAAAVTPSADDKKKPTSAKKPTPLKTSAGKVTAKPTSATKPATSRLGTTPRTTPRPGSATKTATEPAAAKTAQPKTAASKPKTNLTATARTTTRPAASTIGTKPSSGKISATKLVPTPATATKQTSTKTSTTKLVPTPKPSPGKTSNAKPAPRTLSSATTATNSTTAPKPTSRVNLTKWSTASKPSVMKTAAAPKPKVPATTAAKPRVPLTTKPATGRAADALKQIKESANKLTASKGTTGSSTTRTTSGSVRKVDSKTLAPRTTVSKSTTTTTTTTKSTTCKKPTEIIRNKTKTTKIEKPKENGVSTVITEAITIVNTANTVIDNEPQLLKDNSPVDNKLLVEGNNTLIDTNVAD